MAKENIIIVPEKGVLIKGAILKDTRATKTEGLVKKRGHFFKDEKTEDKQLDKKRITD